MIQNQHIGPFNSPWWLEPQHLLTQALLHEMMWRPHMRPDDHVVTWWHAMTVSAQWVITRGAMNKQTKMSRVQIMSRVFERLLGIRSQDQLFTPPILDFRNTFQIVSSQRQKRKAKKNSVQTPPRLILMSVTLSQCQPPPAPWADNYTEMDPGDGGRMHRAQIWRNKIQESVSECR